MQKPHETFRREGNDLVTSVELTLKDALTGWKRQVATIDGRQVPVSSAGPTPPDWRESFPQLGMPNSKSPKDRGNLIVEAKVKFPKSLTIEQKSKLKDIL